MKIRVYIVTYKRNDVLNDNLCSLWAAVPPDSIESVTILANHPSVEIAPENQRSCLRVIVNSTRMPDAWGNLAKDWNFGLLDGFKRWDNPEGVDWVILAQNDIIWKPGWLDALKTCEDLSFITQPRGDQLLAFRIQAVQTVGFFDERFSTLHFHEQDYFFRAAIQLGRRASINDDHVLWNGEWNPKGIFMINATYTGAVEEGNLHTMRSYPEMAVMLSRKWGIPKRDSFHDLKGLVTYRRLINRSLPLEIDWYPFFWLGSPLRPVSLLAEAAAKDALDRSEVEKFPSSFLRRCWKKFVRVVHERNLLD